MVCESFLAVFCIPAVLYVEAAGMLASFVGSIVGDDVGIWRSDDTYSCPEKELDLVPLKHLPRATGMHRDNNFEAGISEDVICGLLVSEVEALVHAIHTTDCAPKTLLELSRKLFDAPIENTPWAISSVTSPKRK